MIDAHTLEVSGSALIEPPELLRQLLMLRKCRLRGSTKSLLLLVGTAGFEYNGPHAGPLFFQHSSTRKGSIGTLGLAWNGKLCGKLFCRACLTNRSKLRAGALAAP